MGQMNARQHFRGALLGRGQLLLQRDELRRSSAT